MVFVFGVISPSHSHPATDHWGKTVVGYNYVKHSPYCSYYSNEIIPSISELDMDISQWHAIIGIDGSHFPEYFDPDWT